MNKRIYKNREKKMLCGVCAGLAEYFDIDPTLVRVLWAVISLGYGIGLLAYIVCAIVFPDKSEVA
jgi:phage shock protein C